jgi:hypothetical protein
MPVRTPGHDYHVVAQRRFSGNVDADDIFCFGVLETVEDLFELAGGGIDATFLALRDDDWRPPFGVYCCQS